MQITITARHFELTKAIRDHVERSCEKLEKYFDHIIIRAHHHGAGKQPQPGGDVVARLAFQPCRARRRSRHVPGPRLRDRKDGNADQEAKDKVTDHQKKSLKHEDYSTHLFEKTSYLQAQAGAHQAHRYRVLSVQEASIA
jgi:hypothetical protein